MSRRLRAFGLLAFAILMAVGYYIWESRRNRAEFSPVASPVLKTAGNTAVQSKVVGEEPQAEASPKTSSVLPGAAKRLAGLPLPEALRCPGINTVAEALAELVEMDESSRAEYFQALLLFCLQNDREGTADLIASLDGEKWRDFGLGFALLHWAEEDPTAALRWAADHPRGENDHTRYHAAYEGFAARHPLDALHALERAEMAGDRDELSRIVIFHFSEQDRLAEARGWIEQLPEGSLRELLVRQTVHYWVQQAPADAANWLASTASDATFRAGMGTLVHTLVEDDPRFAAGLTQRFAEPQIRQDYLADVIYVWAKRDLGAAATWLREQPAGAHLDTAIARMAEAIAPNDPVEARQWANAISDSKKRDEVLRQLHLGG